MAWWLAADARGLDTWLRELRQALETMRRFPGVGRIVARANVEGARTVLVAPYRLIYLHREAQREIAILEVRHLRRDPPQHLDLLK